MHFCISFFQSLLITLTPFDRLVPKALIRSQQKALLPMTWYHGLDHDKEVKGWFCTLKKSSLAFCFKFITKNYLKSEHFLL